jgi:hypothetical protein
MSDQSQQRPAQSFNWKLVFKRAWGGMAIGLMWMTESGLKHDITGMVIGGVLGFIIGPIVAIAWTKHSSGR